MNLLSFSGVMDEERLLIYSLGIVFICLLHMVTLQAGMNLSLPFMDLINIKFVKKENVTGSFANLMNSIITWGQASGIPIGDYIK